ncbi:MAG: hypothetical protein R3D29_01680 [Nitratireductor sp.]
MRRGSGSSAFEDFHRIMFDPSRLREVLGEFTLRNGNDARRSPSKMMALDDVVP